MKSKKSLGQNFFVNKNLCNQIAEIIVKEDPDVIVEIGPGKGTFTSSIREIYKKEMILIEKDDFLTKELRMFMPDLKILNIDFLDWDFIELEKYKDHKILFWGSLPYNVSKPIIRKVVSSKYFLSTSYFIIQKEVAEKYISKEPDNNLLAVQTSIYASTKKLFDISPNSFNPKPKVNSSFISFTPKDGISENLKNEKFLNFLQNSFRQPRKTVRNNLHDITFKNESIVEELLNKRPQHLSLDDYSLLFSKVI